MLLSHLSHLSPPVPPPLPTHPLRLSVGPSAHSLELLSLGEDPWDSPLPCMSRPRLADVSESGLLEGGVEYLLRGFEEDAALRSLWVVWSGEEWMAVRRWGKVCSSGVQRRRGKGAAGGR